MGINTIPTEQVTLWEHRADFPLVMRHGWQQRGHVWCADIPLEM